MKMKRDVCIIYTGTTYKNQAEAVTFNAASAFNRGKNSGSSILLILPSFKPSVPNFRATIHSCFRVLEPINRMSLDNFRASAYPPVNLHSNMFPVTITEVYCLTAVTALVQ
jgi:hypothetical protein